MAKAKQVKSKRRMQKNVAPKACFFCLEKRVVDFIDTIILKRFITERGKIVPRSRNGLCAKHQRNLASSVKHARHLALLSFVEKN
ncbi:MAG: 30S ribosomal protein S18 [Candidatus Levyibacteriota bacterium]